MDQNQLTQLKEDFADYFQIEDQIRINAEPLPQGGDDLSKDDFLALIPEPFLMAGEMVQLNASSLRSLSRLGDVADELCRYLQHMAKKMDLMMHYVLQQQDQAEFRYYTHSYGGSGLCLLSEQPLQVGDWLQLKIFLAQGEGAVFCLGQVIECRPQQEQQLVDVVYRHIRDEDQELIVRASLHEQTRQLKLKKARRNAGDTSE